MNLDKFQLSWIRFLIKEIFIEKELSNLANSMANFWVHTVKDDELRNKLIEEIEQIELKNIIV